MIYLALTLVWSQPLTLSGDLDAAAPLYLEALAAMRATLGDQHAHTLTAIGNLGKSWDYLTRPAD